MVRRRSVLGGIVGLLGLAGCLDNGGTATGNATSATATQLGALQLQNDDRIDHEIQVAIERDDDVVHLETYQLSGDSSTQITGVWDDQRGAYQIHARFDDADIQTVVIDSDTDATDGCTSVLIRIGTDGELEMWTGDCS
jgi:hypothetical protein